MQRNSQKENSLAPYLCLGSKGNKFLHYTAQGGSICVSCSAILCMLVHNANLSRDKLFYIPGPLPGRKAEQKPRYLFLFFFSFSLSFLLFILSLSFIVKGAFLLKWWPTPYIKPILTAAWLAQLGERRSTEREVAGSNPGRTNTQGL